MSGLEEDGTRDLLERGIAAAKSKDSKEARFYLEWALRMNPGIQQQIEALFWLSEISQDPVEKRNLLEDILVNNPSEARARRSLAILDGRLKPEEIINPDRFGQPVPEIQDLSDPKRFICPNCGGRMTFTPDGVSLTCEYCQNRENLTHTSTQPEALPEQDFILAMATAKGHLQPVKQHVFSCAGCGTRFMLPASQLTITCPYCSSAYVAEDNSDIELIPPTALVPFSIDEVHAKQALKIWLGDLAADSSLKVNRGFGMYIPVWAFNIGGSISWHCQVRSGKNWIDDKSEKLIYHTNILELASDRLSPECAEGIYHFSLENLVPFDDRYLADWPAETYKMTVADASLKARQQVLMIERKTIDESFTSAIRNLVLNTSEMSIDTFKLILLPVWLTRFAYENDIYQVLISGQTARVFAKTPPGKFQRWVNNMIRK